jgi:hypothetical protein
MMLRLSLTKPLLLFLKVELSWLSRRSYYAKGTKWKPLAILNVV